MKYLKSIVVAVVIMAIGIGNLAEARILGVDQSTPTAFQTIQDAVDAATDGDTIMIKKGRYAGAIVDKAVNIKGNSQVIIDIGIEIYSFPYGTRGFQVIADGVTISHLTIEGVGIGVEGRGSVDNPVGNIVVSNVDIRNLVTTYRPNGTEVGAFGVYVYRGQEWTIAHNDISLADGFPGYGIYISRGQSNLVAFNSIEHFEQAPANSHYFGVALLRTQFNKIVHNTILIDAEKRACIYIGHYTSTDNIIGFNDFRGSTVDGLLLLGASADENLIEGNLGLNRSSVSDADASGFRPVIEDE